MDQNNNSLLVRYKLLNQVAISRLQLNQWVICSYKWTIEWHRKHKQSKYEHRLPLYPKAFTHQCVSVMATRQLTHVVWEHPWYKITPRGFCIFPLNTQSWSFVQSTPWGVILGARGLKTAHCLILPGNLGMWDLCYNNQSLIQNWDQYTTHTETIRMKPNMTCKSHSISIISYTANSHISCPDVDLGASPAPSVGRA